MSENLIYAIIGVLAVISAFVYVFYFKSGVMWLRLKIARLVGPDNVDKVFHILAQAVLFAEDLYKGYKGDPTGQNRKDTAIEFTLDGLKRIGLEDKINKDKINFFIDVFVLLNGLMKGENPNKNK
jgi:hypothetical protein